MAGDALKVADTLLSIGTIDVGFPLTDVWLGFAVANGFARVHDLSGNVLGGKFTADPFDYELETDKTTLAVELSGIYSGGRALRWKAAT